MTTRLVLVLLTMLLALAGCSAVDGSTTDTAAGPAAGDGASLAGSGEGGSDSGAEGVADEATVAAPPVAATDAEGAMMVRRVTLEVLVDDVAAAAGRARAAATAVDGWVSSEEVSPGGEDRAGWGTLVLRVPSEDLDAVVATLSELGEVTASRSQADDVAAEYRDVEARVETLEAGAGRLRDLVGQATSVESIAALERELADREAELDALKARIAVLAQDVSRSTVTVHLAEDRETLAETVPATGFLAGLRAGWEAFGRSLTVLLTAVGALLPFLAVAALVLVPWLVLRRRRRRGGPVTPTPTAAGPAPGAGAGSPDSIQA